ncbi:MAG TPA: chloride channel protein [Candidatus Choladousia intestinipullorum]|uniref:Chloride channel protein n=1 Tax=Candidatus Anaerobutyricum stercoripullorum TaxID=2838456 RepID=A0A9D1X873_9FIRM|nr:chloride channel protein [Candidatus Choladousia intestinipullorum]HIX73205.1 chloride channel protein [Candidatus Anaerobutyricum stercoripullorum]
MEKNSVKQENGGRVHKDGVNNHIQEIRLLGMWILLGIAIGIVVGAASTAFSWVLTAVTDFRAEHPEVFFLLPAAGAAIVFLYRKFAQNDGGTNQVLATIQARDDVLFRSAPLIFISTALTHLAGGSAGREGAAIQLGGSIGNQIGKWIRLDDADRHMIVMCGMSAAFAALFGTPMAAAIFSLEVTSVGVMYYAALMPCVIASLVASHLAGMLGVQAEAFRVMDIPEITVLTCAKMLAVAISCAAISMVFCMALQGVGKLYEKWLKNPYVRAAAAGCLVIVITEALQTDVYMGAGAGLIQKAVEQGQADYFSFFWKILLTAITMKAGFKGGEIVPAFCVGATFGCVAGQILGISPSFCAAAGMISVFCGVTNCPITSVLIAFEMFGFEGETFYLAAVAVSYAFSGHYSLYKEQRIVYSKYKAVYVNDRTK